MELKEDDLKKYKGIFKSLNNFFIKKHRFNLNDMDITNIKGFLDYLYYMPRIELIDNLNNSSNVNYKFLNEIGLIKRCKYDK